MKTRNKSILIESRMKWMLFLMPDLSGYFSNRAGYCKPSLENRAGCRAPEEVLLQDV